MVMVRTPRTDQLAAALRAHAKGDLGVEAAVELLIANRSWLVHPDFARHVVAVHTPAGVPTAFVHWAAAIHDLGAHRLPCSSSEGQILRLAASLAAGIPVDLGVALSGLDKENTRYVCSALARAAGHPVPTPNPPPLP